MIERDGDLPRIRFWAPTGHQTPEGYFTSGELLEYLLPKWWGGLYFDLGSEISGHPVDHGSPLGEAATFGPLYECVRLIRDAGERRELEGLVPRDPANPDTGTFNRITPADWTATDLWQWQSELMLGEVFRYSDDFMAWADGKPIFFRWAGQTPDAL